MITAQKRGSGHLVAVGQDGRPISVDRLVEDIWGDQPPGNPAAALQAKVSQLRVVLDESEEGGRRRLESRPPGYVLHLDAQVVDAGRFAALIGHAQAAGDPRSRVSLLSEALALWRGPAFADFADAPFVRAPLTSLDEQRLVVLEEVAEARLELGEHPLLAGELGDLITQYPLRERLRAAHLRALYRAGRQSEALASYRDLRERAPRSSAWIPAPSWSSFTRPSSDRTRTWKPFPTRDRQRVRAPTCPHSSRS